jgi:hypothetical protein
MPISFTCVTKALLPFIPGPLELPIPGFDDWVLHAPLTVSKAAASQFQLRADEFETFDLWWAVSKEARELHELDRQTDGKGPMAVETRVAFDRLAAIVNDSAQFDSLGYEHVQRVPAGGRYVVFSDHHMGFAGGRHDVFATSGNRELYGLALTAYADAGFTLVENGDVEELIIHEPMAPPPQAELAARQEWRKVQLAEVIANHRALYTQINEQFLEQGRYIRIAGNHDQDLQDPAFLKILQGVYPTLEQVYDFLIIEPAEDAPAFVIGHGHHFDTASTPAFAAQYGEMLSECLGWAYEGADRVWRWGNGDGVEEWASGQEAFTNTLVTDDAEPYELSTDVEAALINALTAELAPVLPWNTTPEAVFEVVEALVAELYRPGLWEDEIFSGNIAWEHFRSDNVAEAVFNEVFCGQRWFKFRHLDEVFIAERLEGQEPLEGKHRIESVFGADPPYLLLGHSHEPRHRSWNPATSVQSDRYLNSGSAGRFENLIWCTEIIDGVPQIAAWHRPGGPESDATPERRTYTPGLAGAAGTLTASDAHIPVPAAGEQERQRTWLAPVLHTMLTRA